MPPSKAYRSVRRGGPSFLTTSTLHSACRASVPRTGRTCLATKSGLASTATRSSNRSRISLRLSVLACMVSLAHAAPEGRLELREIEVRQMEIIAVVGRRPLHEAPERDQVVIGPVER